MTRTGQSLKLSCVASVRSSITSSDSDTSDQLGKQQRIEAKPGAASHQPRPNQDSASSRGMHERQSSATSRQGVDNPKQGPAVDGRGAGFRDGSAMQRTGGPIPLDSVSGHHQRTDSGASRVSQSHSANYIHGGSSSGADGGGSSADLYGTLPRNKSRKPTSEAPASAEVYQLFLNKQKCLQAGVTSSQQSLDSVKSDSGSDHSSAGSGQQKMSKSEIRQLLQDNFVQRQRQQAGGLQHAPQQYSQQPGAVQQFCPQQRQELRPPGQQSVMPQRPGQTYGQSVPHSQPANFTWQQQQQQQQQQHYPPHPQQHQHPAPPHPHLQQQQQQQNPVGHYPQSQPQRQPPPSAAFQPPSQTPGHGPHPAQKPSAPGGPPVPGQKPSIPYPSSVAKARNHSSQGPPFPPPHPDSSTEVGRRAAPQNVARVAPNSHMSGGVPPGNGGSYLVMMPPSSSSSSSSSCSSQQQQQSLPTQPGGHMRHTASALHLAGLTLTPGFKPLERCASQPDCQKLVDSAYPANLSGIYH